MTGSPRVLRITDVCQRTGLARSTIYLRVSQGKFPRPFSLGSGGAVGWLESEIETWISDCVATRITPDQLAAA